MIRSIGLRRVLGVERREDEVAGLRRGQRRADRLHVAHLADEDHVGVLAQRGLEAHREGLGVRPDLALVDDALLVRVQELDRVLDGEDVVVARLVDLVDDRRERGRLARARRPRDEDDPAGLLGEAADDRRQAELLDRHRLVRDQAERGAEGAALEVGVDAEAPLAGTEYAKSSCQSVSRRWRCEELRIV
jgi:hypothetical protein